MTSRERVDAVLSFQKPDRLPMIEWAPYWDKTVDRWHSEGLPADINHHQDLCDYFELDPLLQIWVRPRGPNCPEPASHGAPVITSESDYDAIRQYLYPDPAVDPAALDAVARAQENGAAFWFTLEGFFWHPRMLFGIEEHLYAFYDQPGLMRRMNEDNAEFMYRVVDVFCKHLSPQFMTFAEDMSYNHGPMISKDMFDEHIAPLYRPVVEYIRSRGVVVMVDSDGFINDPVDWYLATGCQGFLPLEKQAGVDVAKLREKHPDIRLLGAFDKMCMSKGEEAMRMEFERLLPVMKQGGYIPGVDHQTPPEVSLENYRIYLKLLREYSEKAVK